MSTIFPQNQNQTATTTNETAGANGSETTDEVVDLNEEQTVEDASTDFNVVPSPPPAKRYPMKVTLHEDGIDGRKGKTGTFLNIPLVLKIADGGTYEGYEVRTWVNNIYNKLKGTTKAHWLLHCLGIPVPRTIKHADLKLLIEKALLSEPVCMVDLEWQASYKDSSDKRANDQGYVTWKNRMSQFTKNPDGTYNHELASPVDNTPIYARAYITDDGFHVK